MNWILIIPALPALLFVLLTLLPRSTRNKGRFVSIAGATVVLALALYALYQASSAGITGTQQEIWQFSWPLATIAGHELVLHMHLGAVAAAVLPMVAFVAWCVQVFSLGYMADDERKGWYYALVSLFSAAMLSFVLAADFLLAFVSWEIMGVCSYFLIGFWFTEKDPREASIKAFITTRIGDLGFFFALMVIFANVGSFEYAKVFSAASTWPQLSLYLICGGLLLAAVGKSAQIPLHVWLPDAMAGPTPASALIHAATMVAAGVLLLAQSMPLFVLAPEMLMAILVIGLVTSLMAGFIACVQQDIKKVLAYSTVSQLGLMFCALGVASVSAALFHLLTHGFFKALLFLGAGFIIHATGTQDMREMGGLRKKLPITWLVFLVGTLALAGVPPFSGFFSKDEIVHSLFEAQMPLAAIGVLAASLLTAFYMARLYFKVFEGSLRGHCHKEHGVAMLLPLALLAICAAGAGALSLDFGHLMGAHAAWPTIDLIAMSLAVAILGIGSAWYLYGRAARVEAKAVAAGATAGAGAAAGTGNAAAAGSTEFQQAEKRLCPDTTPEGVAKRSGFYKVCFSKFYFDDINDKVWIGGTKGLAKLIAWVDKRFIDGIVNLLAFISKGLGALMRRIQSGRLQQYQRWSAVAVIIFMIVVFCIVKGA